MHYDDDGVMLMGGWGMDVTSLNKKRTKKMLVNRTETKKQITSNKDYQTRLQFYISNVLQQEQYLEQY